MADADPMIPYTGSQELYTAKKADLSFFSEKARIGKCVRSSEGKTLYINSAFCSWMGINSDQAAEDKTLEQFISPLSRHISLLQQLEKQVFQDGAERMCVFSVVPPFGGPRVLSSMRLIYCGSSGGEEGCLWIWQEYQIVSIFSSASTLSEISVFGKRWHSPFEIMSVREWEIIWPLLFGYRKTAIAESLGLTLKHVNRVIHKILVKIKSSDIDQLAGELLRHGFNQVIPEGNFFIIKADQ